ENSSNKPAAAVRVSLFTYYLSLICIASLGIGVGRLLLTHCDQYYTSGYVLALVLLLLLLS
ncbi:hypothetical protein B0T09DRAFT_246529, partial [Sordaria sp. MPI-SDFR-AT-0083]